MVRAFAAIEEPRNRSKPSDVNGQAWVRIEYVGVGGQVEIQPAVCLRSALALMHACLQHFVTVDKRFIGLCLLVSVHIPDRFARPLTDGQSSPLIWGSILAGEFDECGMAGNS